MRSSQLAILAALNSKPKDPEPVGWFKPNDPRLLPTLRNVRAAGKGIAAAPSDNGFIFLYAVEQALALDPMKDRGKWPIGVLVGLTVKTSVGEATPQKGIDQTADEIVKRKDANGDKQPGSSQPWDF